MSLKGVGLSSKSSMAKVSVIIPSRNEKLLSKTVDDIFVKATGEIEVIVVLDGPTNYPLPARRLNLRLIEKPKAEGLRVAVNDAVKIATGEYLLKIDAHCMFKKGFDEALQADCEDNWVVVARRYTLDPNAWEPMGPAVDYYYLGCPWTNRDGFIMKDHQWGRQTKKRAGVLVDDLMTFQGSMWFMPLGHFRRVINRLDHENYGFAVEQQEVGFKTWLSGGRAVINKKTWYAHLHPAKDKERGYRIDMGKVNSGRIYSAHYWTQNKWKERVRDFDWVIEKFWRVPNWPKAWRGWYEKGLK